MERLCKLDDMGLHRKLLHEYLDQILDLRVRSFYAAPNWKQNDEISKQRMYDEEYKLNRAIKLYDECVAQLDDLYYVITGKKLNEDSDT